MITFETNAVAQKAYARAKSAECKARIKYDEISKLNYFYKHKVKHNFKTRCPLYAHMDKMLHRLKRSKLMALVDATKMINQSLYRPDKFYCLGFCHWKKTKYAGFKKSLFSTDHECVCFDFKRNATSLTNRHLRFDKKTNARDDTFEIYESAPEPSKKRMDSILDSNRLLLIIVHLSFFFFESRFTISVARA